MPFAVALAVAVTGCAPESVPTAEPPETNIAAKTPPETKESTPATPAPKTGEEQEKAQTETAPKAKTTGKEVAVIETSQGRIVFEFLTDKAPKTVESFKKLAGRKFYDGTKFHRVIPGFMIQGGDPNSKNDDKSDDGMGGPGFNLAAEFNDTKHVRGIVSMARASDPNSAGSQFFICVADSNFLDGQYTAFGRVIEGMDVADKIVELPRDANDNPDTPAIMKTVRIEKR
jgi:cyclophilin family peptidyl-prolyl cis-trans isomerase